MDTPNRNHNQRQPRQPWQPWQPQNGTPMCSQCQDSLVFNYLKNLSPIKTVESVHLAHALGFPAIPSVFKSPHIDIRKESKPLSRYPLSDMSKPEFFYQDGDERNLCMGVSNVVKLSDHIGRTQEDDNLMYTLDEPIVIPPDECSTRPTKQPESFQYDSGSPNHNNSLSLHMKSDFVMGSTSMLEIVPDDLQGHNRFSHMPELGGVQQNEELREVQACDWENLISDDNDELPFGSSSDFETLSFTTQNYIDHDPSCTFLSSRLPQNTTDNTLTTQPDGYFGDFHQNASGEFFAKQVREYTEKNDVDYTSQILSVYEQKSMRGEPVKKMVDGSGDCFIGSDNKALFQQQRVMRRRCLALEMAETTRNNLRNDLNSALSSSHHGQFTSSAGQETTLKPGISHFTRRKPSIRLHLYAAPKDMIAHDVCPSAKQPINMPCSISQFPSVPNGQETVNNPLSAEKDNPESNIKNLLLVQDFPQAPVCEKSDHLSHISPKKKKQRIENGSDGDSCKWCNCKKSKCLKLYCECFAAGVYCVETCSCQGCLNKPQDNPQHEETVIQTRKQIESRNPLAFAPKVIRTPEPVSEIGEEANKTPASARHKRGCNCKKSSCLKKYCECYQGGVGCSISCRCEGCKNTFGRKDGTMPGGTEETDPEEAALDSHEKDAEKPDTKQNTYAQNDKHPSSENSPITPFTCRSCMQLLFLSSLKPPRSSMLSIGATPKLSTAKEARVKFEAPHSKQHFRVPTDDETPDNLLQSDSSPISGVKVVSPSRKRISPPSNENGVSPSRKGCRKLILKSIPSFPPLTFVRLRVIRTLSPYGDLYVFGKR